jgi:hypothetical protein
MDEAENWEFCLRGLYRVQSYRESTPSSLFGRWIDPLPGLTPAKLNAALTEHPAWLGTALVRLRPAHVLHRTGAFRDHADALYYRAFFTPERGSMPLEVDVLDVTKLTAHWNARADSLRALFDEGQFDGLAHAVGDVRRTAVNEYLCHEAGHALGFDIHTKYGSGYFRVGARTAWPLVFVEEFRADMLALGFARSLLDPPDAVAVFAYHVCHRFGLARESAIRGSDGAGAVPYLLFALLRELGALGVRRRGGRHSLGIDSLATDSVLAIMGECERRTHAALCAVELGATDALDVAINAARYFRARSDDTRLASEFAAAVGTD